MKLSLRPAVRRGVPRSTLDWELQDVCFFTYLGVVIVMLLAFGVRGEAAVRPWSLIGIHLLIAGVGLAAILIAARWNTVLTRLIRWWYPAFLFTFCFEAVGQMIGLIRPRLIDAYLVAADQFVFGTVLTPVLQSQASWWLTELMYVCYSSYYFLVPGVGLALYIGTRDPVTGNPGEPFRRFMLAVSLTFWVCYLHFLLTPAGGPVFWADYPGPVRHLEGGVITSIEQWVFAHGTIVGGAFPSSHVAIALVVAMFSLRYSVVPVLVVPLAIGLAISTVYAGYHYGVDVLYGMIVGACCERFSGMLFDRRERSNFARRASECAGA